MRGLTEINPADNPMVELDAGDIEILPSDKNMPAKNSHDGLDKLAGAAADNFPQILSLAEGIVEIRKMKVQSEAVLKQMDKQRENLLAEAEAYVKKKNADTNSVVEKMKIVRDMMNDYYKYSGNANISGDTFRMIISDIVNNMKQV